MYCPPLSCQVWRCINIVDVSRTHGYHQRWRRTGSQDASLTAQVSAGLDDLRAFGVEAEARRWPRIDISGVILPGEDAQLPWCPGTEGYANARDPRRARQGVGRSEARPRQGSQTEASEASAPGSASHAVQCRVIEEDLEELKEYYPNSAISFGSSSFIHIWLPLTLFHSLPYRARLLLEIPLQPRADRMCSALNASGLGRAAVSMVPDVRAWAFWEDGIIARSHHQMPDLAICACQPRDWALGVHALYEYVDFCVVWLGKLLHEQLLGFWPGVQHYGDLAMQRRDRPREYCGCGSTKRYAACHREAIQRASMFGLYRGAMDGRSRYLAELRWQRRAPHPPGWQVRSVVHL